MEETKRKDSEWYNKQLQALFILLREQSGDVVDKQFIFNRLNDIMSEQGLILHRKIMEELSINVNGDPLHKVPYSGKSPNETRNMLLKGYQLWVDKDNNKWWRETIYNKK